MSKGKSMFSLVPELILFVWQTRRHNNAVTRHVRLFLLAFVLLLLFITVSAAGIKSTISNKQYRIDVANTLIVRYPGITEVHAKMIGCLGSPYWIFSDDTLWVECDLAAMDSSSAQGHGLEYIRFAKERNEKIESSMSLYPIEPIAPRK